MAEEHKDNWLQHACTQGKFNSPGTVDNFPLSPCQDTLATTVVSSPSLSDFKAAGDSCSPHRDDCSTQPSGDAGRRGTCSTDPAQLCEELQESDQPHSISCSSRSYPRMPASQKPDIFQRQQSIDALVSPNAARSFDSEWTSFTEDFQTADEGCVAGGGRRSSGSDCPLLESLLVWGSNSGDKMATAVLAASGRAETVDAPMSTNEADSFDDELTRFTTDFEARYDGNIAGDGASPSQLDCPILTSLLVCGHSSGDKTVTAEYVTADQAEVATCRTEFWQRQGRVDPGRQTPPPKGVDAEAAVQASPNAARNTQRHLNSCDVTKIRKMARVFLRAMRLPPCCRQQMLPSSLLYSNRIDSIQHLIVYARNSALRLLRFACQLPQFLRQPPHVQVALLKAASAGCMVLHLAHSYNCERGCWLNSDGAEFRPQDLTRLVPSPTRPELWEDVAAVGVFLKSLVCSGSESVDGDDDDSMVRFFSLLNAALIMSPENVPCLRENDRDIAADVSDYQQSCIFLLRRHLESSLSLARAAELLPTLLMHLVAIRSLAMDVRIALLSERMVRRDSVLGDALSLKLAMF